MKCVILFICVFLSLSLSAQKTETKTMLTKTDYLTKSKKQKNTAFILLGAGVAFIATGAIIPEGAETDDFLPTCFCYANKNDGIKGAFIMAGGLSAIVSIPFFIASGKNKRRAAAVSLNTEKINFPVKNMLVQATIPAISLKFTL
jgi:hypothetical protein